MLLHFYRTFPVSEKLLSVKRTFINFRGIYCKFIGYFFTLRINSSVSGK